MIYCFQRLTGNTLPRVPVETGGTRLRGNATSPLGQSYTKMSVEAFSRAAAQQNLYLNEEKWSDTNGM